VKKWIDHFQWNDRTKLAAAAAATGAVLLFAILFPLVFLYHPAETTDRGVALDSRAKLFVRYWNAKDEENGISEETIAEPKPETAALCEARMDGIVAVSIPDRALEERTPTGSEYLKISEGDAEVNLCRMWLERSGDWKNWLDVCFDADTGELYYLYLSCACLKAPEAYEDDVNARVEQLAETLAACMDGEIRLVETDGTAQTVMITTPEGTIGYRLDCNCSERLVDIKINCF